MFSPTTTMIDDCIIRLQVGYRQTYGDLKQEYADLITQVAAIALTTIARSDALYHNVEHTILVTLVGQEILRGKHQQEGNVSCRDWMHFMISLLCHDIGYVRGVCQRDDGEARSYAVGVGDGMVAIAAGATDASLTPYHVDRGKQFVQETLAEYALIDLAVVKQNIELTRFPVPNDELHQDTIHYPGLARAADLIGQLSDPRYLEKIPALFYEFEETGSNQALGYNHPADLRMGYPKFFHHVVCPLIQPAMGYLCATEQGRQILKHLHTNVVTVERELAAPTQRKPRTPSGPHLLQNMQRLLQASNADQGNDGTVFLSDCAIA